MKCILLLGLLAFARAHPGLVSYSYANPAGVTFRNTGGTLPALTAAAPAVAAAPAPAVAHAHVAAPAYAHAAPVYAHAHSFAAPVKHVAPAVPVTHHVGYANHQVLTKVPGVAQVPVTKVAYSKGFTQKDVDVAHPAVATRRVKVRRPALRKDFYDIEHRIIVRPAGSATVELSHPLSKKQEGPTVLTPTNYQPIAPVVRYGTSRRILDGQGAPSAPQQQQPAPEFRSAAPQEQPAAPAPQPQPAPQQQAQEEPQLRSGPIRPLTLRPAEPQQQGAAPAPQPQQQPEARAAAPQDDAIVVGAEQGQEAQAAPAPQQQSGQPQTRSFTLTPNMPAELQARLLELLSAKGGTVTELLGKDGQPESASVLDVADSLHNIDLQGGERTTTRRIVVTRPIETVQEVEIQEPATKVHRVAVKTPTLFKHHVPGYAHVPVAVPAVKNVATPVVKTTYAAAAPAYAYPAGYAVHHK